MKNFSQRFHIKTFFSSFKETILRFPLSVFLQGLTTFLFIILINNTLSSNLEDMFVRISLSCIVSFFLSVWVYLLWEAYFWEGNKKKVYLLQLFVLVFGVLFYFWMSADLFERLKGMVYFLLTLLWVLSFLFFAPFLPNLFQKKMKTDFYYAYFIKIATIFFFSFILWGLLFLLWMIAIIAFFSLFDISVNEWRIIWYWASFSLIFITPLFALKNLPQIKSIFKKNLFSENKFFSFLVKYVGLSFIFIYFLILYIYTIKVLLHFQDWPKWEVSWLVIGFSSFWYLIYIFSYFYEENIFIKRFRMVFPFIVFPQIFMLFYAIYLRIHQYDLTINRYFIFVFWVWLLFVSLYYIFSKKKELLFIPLSLTLFTLIISVWPWSVYQIPESRQLARLEKNLLQAWILQDGKIIPLTSYQDISKELSNEIYDWIHYICDINDCESIKSFFFEKSEDLENEIKAKFGQIISVSDWQIISFTTDFIKVKSQYQYSMWENGAYISINIGDNFFPIDLEGYDKILKLNIYDTNNTKYIDPDYLYLFYNVENSEIELKDSEQNTLDSFSNSEIEDTIYKIYLEKWNNWFEKSDLIFDISTEKYDYKLFFQNIRIHNPDYNGERRYLSAYINGYGLIRER